ncbi:MAG: CDP-glycerol glycerophosphotransferase family protein, partial [Lachnospiraceae bacterium]|nr:CDP-glycerol glycerophosphotransferase family protein [Lachnospiraceae bacterium]
AETDKWRPVLLKAIDDAPNIFLDRSSDYHDTLMNADAIITDWSSITMEAAVTGVPVMYVKNKDCESAFLPAVADILRSYYQGLGCADMLEFVGAVIDGRDPQRGRRQEAIEKCLPYLDGKCGKRMADDVYCGIAEPEKAGKLRVILFGTGRVFSTICGYPLKDGIEAIAAADNDSRKWGTVVNGFKVIAPHEMQDYVFDRIVVAVNSDQYEQILMQLYSEYDIPLSKITRVDSFLEMLDI